MTKINFIRANRDGKPKSLRELPWNIIDFDNYKLLNNSGTYAEIAFDNKPSGRWILRGDITFGSRGINSTSTIISAQYRPFLGLKNEYISIYDFNMTLKKFKKLIKGNSKRIEKRILKNADHTLNTINGNIVGSGKSDFITGSPYDEPYNDIDDHFPGSYSWRGDKFKFNSRYSINGGKGNDIIAFDTGNVEVYGGKGNDIFNVDMYGFFSGSTRPATSHIMDAKKGDKIYVNGTGIHSSYGGPGMTSKTEVVKTATGYDLIFQRASYAGTTYPPETFLSIKGHDLEYQGINELTAAEIPHKSFDEYHYMPYMIFA